MAQHNPARKHQYVVCIKNEDYPASLELRKIYRTVPQADNRETAYLRVIAESGEDYLYPAEYFVPIRLPKAARQAFSASS